MMRIEDEDLRVTFEVSSNEQLQTLVAGLADLEDHPEEFNQWDTILEAISQLHENVLALELKTIAPLTYQIQHLLGAIASGQKQFSPELQDRLGVGLDAICQLVTEAVTGEASGVNSFYVLAHLMGAVGEQDTDQINLAEAKSRNDTDGFPARTQPNSQQHKSAYIDDEELRYTFKITCEEHLQKLDNGLLHLEKHPNDRPQLEELLREIHSIKGDAGMLGVDDIVPVAHEWEQQLIPVKEGQIPFSKELSDRLYRGVDVIRQLAHSAVTGEPATIDLHTELTRLTQKTQLVPGDDPSTSTLENTHSIPPSFPEPTKDIVVSHPQPLTPFPPTTPSILPPETSYRIDTIRVETRSLDTLMTQAGELMVAQTRIAHRLDQIKEMVTLWETWSRDTLTHCLAMEAHYNTPQFPQCTLTFLQGTHRRLTRSQQWEQVRTLADHLKSALVEDAFRLQAISQELEEGIRTLRLLPLKTIFNLFPRLVRDLSNRLGKDVDFVVTGEDTRVDKRILEELKDPLMHILQNAIDHGIESPYERELQGKSARARLGLRGYQTTTHVVIEIMDDGRGIDLEKVKQKAIERGLYRAEELAVMTAEQIHSLIFQPGFSTRSFVTEVSGRGVGMDVVRANVERLKGSIQIQSQPGAGCILRLQFGISLATAPVLLLEVEGITYGLPLEVVTGMLWVDLSLEKESQHVRIFSLEGQAHILYEDQPIPVVPLADLLEVRGTVRVSPRSESEKQPCVIIQVGKERLGLLVDGLIDRQDVILKPQSRLLKRVRNISGATILGTGDVCMVLAPPDLIESVRSSTTFKLNRRLPEPEIAKSVILLVEDSITTRTQEKRILESAGYEVVTAVDGWDGLNQLKTRDFDAVVSDIQMPNMDGLEMTARIRQYPQYNELPIILVTSLASDADRRKGAEVGASAYITKHSFDQDVLLETLRRLI